MLNAVDVIGRAMQATHSFMENAERKQVENDQVIGLHSSSIASLQAGNTTMSSSMLAVQSEVAGMKTSTPGGTKHHNVLDSKSIQTPSSFGATSPHFGLGAMNSSMSLGKSKLANRV